MRIPKQGTCSARLQLPCLLEPYGKRHQLLTAGATQVYLQLQEPQMSQMTPNLMKARELRMRRAMVQEVLQIKISSNFRRWQQVLTAGTMQVYLQLQEPQFGQMKG